MPKYLKDFIKPLCIILFLIFYYFLYTFVVQRYSNQMNYLPYNIWIYVWTFILVIIFSFDYLKTFNKSGTLKINAIYLFLALLMLTMYIPSTPLFKFNLLGKSDIILLIFWYSLIHSFKKE